MPVGADQQYDLSWVEQDKIRRRLEIKRRLKLEAVHMKFDPYRNIKGQHYSDPAIDRFMDYRKRGRTPGAPLKASVFFSMVALVFIPIFGMTYVTAWERSGFLAKCASGELAYKDRKGKSNV